MTGQIRWTERGVVHIPGSGTQFGIQMPRRANHENIGSKSILLRGHSYEEQRVIKNGGHKMRRSRGQGIRHWESQEFGFDSKKLLESLFDNYDYQCVTDQDQSGFQYVSFMRTTVESVTSRNVCSGPDRRRDRGTSEDSDHDAVIRWRTMTVVEVV